MTTMAVQMKGNGRWTFTLPEMSMKPLKTIIASLCLGCLAASLGLAQPFITLQPKDEFLSPGQTARFTLNARGALTLQWRFDGMPIAGATGYLLTVTNAQPAQSGYYSVILSNASGSVTSQLARLKVFLPSPTEHAFNSIQVSPNRSASLSFTGDTTLPFARYYDLYPLETSSNLVDWAPLTLLQRTNGEPDSLDFVDTHASNFSQRFYRTPTNQLATPDPQPTGPYAIGTFSMLLIDSSRTNKVLHTSHQFMITFWYPAIAQAGVLPAQYVEPQVAAGPAFFNLAMYGAANFGSQVAQFFSHSISNAPMATNLAKYPIILYSTGFEGHRRENTDKAEDLASWGYIVVGLDNENTFVSVFPDGMVVNGQTSGDLAAEIEDWLLDQQFVLDELEGLNANDARLAGRLDLDKIGAFGWSLGGATSAQLCLRDPRCKAGAGMDGDFFETNVLAHALSVPYLFFRSDDGPDGPPDDRLEFFNEQTTNAYWVKLASTVHGNFSDPGLIIDSASLAAVWGTPLNGQFLSPARVSQIVRAYLLSFFNKFLRGEDDHLLDSASPAYPEVMQFLKK
jgi:dienelactone hydrolase